MIEAKFKLPYKQVTVFNTIPAAFKNLGWRLDDLNPQSFRFRGKTKWSFWGWSSKIEGWVNEINSRQSQLYIEGKITKQLMDPGVTEERIMKFMNELTTILSNNDIVDYQFYRPFTGTGKTEQNAIFFTDAANPQEHIKLQYEFMQFNGIVSRMQSMINPEKDDMQEEMLYDLQDTNVGQLWFKHPPILTKSEIQALLDKIEQKKKEKSTIEDNLNAKYVD